MGTRVSCCAVLSRRREVAKRLQGGENEWGGGGTRGESRLRALCEGCVPSAGIQMRGTAAEGRGKAAKVKD